MVIDYGRVGSDSGSFVFIRLPDEIDQTKHWVAAWAETLSSQHFDGIPIVVHNHDKQNNEILTVWPEHFHPAVIGMTGAGVGLATMEVAALPPRS